MPTRDGTIKAVQVQVDQIETMERDAEAADNGARSRTRRGRELARLKDIEQDLADGTLDMSVEELFNTIDANEDGAIDLREFEKLHEIVTAHTRIRTLSEASKAKELVAESKRARLFQKMAMFIGLMLFIMLVGNAGLTAAVVTFLKDTSLSNDGIMLSKVTGMPVTTGSTEVHNEGGTLVDPNTHEPVKVSTSHKPLRLDSRLPNNVLDELLYLDFSSSAGGYLHMAVQAYSRVVTMPGVACEEPLFGSYLRFQTAVGAVWLDGDIITFEDGMEGVFHTAGFKVSGRRLQSAFELVGIFNSVPAFVGWNSTYDAPPQIPTTFYGNITVFSACPPEDDPAIGPQPICHSKDPRDLERVAFVKGHPFVMTKLTIEADSEQGLVRESRTEIAGLEGWMIETINDQTNLYESQVWTDTNERYFCRFNSSEYGSSTIGSGLQSSGSGEHLLGVFKGEEEIDGELRLKFTIKSRRVQGLVIDYEVVAPNGMSAADGSSVTEVHPRWIMVQQNAIKSNECGAAPVQGFAMRWDSFRPLEPNTLDFGWTTARAGTGSPFDCSATQRLTNLADEDAMISSPWPFMPTFGVGPRFSNLHIALTIKKHEDGNATAAAVAGDFNFGMHSEPGGMELGAMLYHLHVDENVLVRFADQYDESTGSADLAGVHVVTAPGGELVEHDTATWAVRQHEWATKIAYSHSLGYLKELLVWRLHEQLSNHEAGSTYWQHLMAGSLTWDEESQAIVVRTTETMDKASEFTDAFDPNIEQNTSRPPLAGRRLSKISSKNMAGCPDKKLNLVNNKVVGNLLKKMPLDCKAYTSLGCSTCGQKVASRTTPGLGCESAVVCSKDWAPVPGHSYVQWKSGGNFHMGAYGVPPQAAFEGCIGVNFKLSVAGVDVGTLDCDLCLKGGTKHCGKYETYVEISAGIKGSLGSCSWGCAKASGKVKVYEFPSGGCWEDTSKTTLEISASLCGSGICGEVWSGGPWTLGGQTVAGNDNGCDSSCDNDSSCDGSCDGSCDSCDDSCDSSCDGWLSTYCDSSCDSSCDKSCDSGCDSSCDTHTACDDSCDSVDRRRLQAPAGDGIEDGIDLSVGWSERLAQATQLKG
jgi:hypothetical protein